MARVGTSSLLRQRVCSKRGAEKHARTPVPTLATPFADSDSIESLRHAHVGKVQP
jgi:hypothetical protein